MSPGRWSVVLFPGSGHNNRLDDDESSDTEPVADLLLTFDLFDLLQSKL